MDRDIPTESWFDPDFDQALGEDLIRQAQQRLGCFNCRSPGAHMKCSKCGVAVYCNRACQTSHWKGDPRQHANCHKVMCKQFLEMAKPPGPRARPHPLIVRLRGIDCISQQVCDDALRRRRDLFLEMAKKPRGADAINFGFTLECHIRHMFQDVCLCVAVTFMYNWQNACVPLLFMEKVEQGVEAMTRYVNSGNKLSSRGKKVAAKKMVEVLNTMSADGVPKCSMMTIGHGFPDWHETLKSELKKNGYGDLTIVPSQHAPFNLSDFRATGY